VAVPKGFTPWAFKYVDQKHDGVPTEWETVRITSTYNVYLDADACCINGMANAAFFQHFPLKPVYAQIPRPTRADLVAKGFILPDGQVAKKTFVMFYVGDYDAAAWVYSQLKSKWDDPNRGRVPLGWALNPNLKDRFPVMWDYVFRNLTVNDRIITGDSGAGYLNPTGLYAPRVPSGLPDAEQLWLQHCMPLYNQFNISFTGFVIQGYSGKITTQAEQLYQKLSPDGWVLQTGYSPNGNSLHLAGTSPVFVETDIPGNPSDAANQILSHYTAGKTDFQVYRSILQAPTYHLTIANQIEAQSKGGIVVVEPLVLSYLAKVYLGVTTE